mgnify:CR=1 FL=1
MAKPTDQEIQTGLEKQAEESNTALTLLYGGSVNIGTEEMGSEDLNTPILKIIQSNTQGIEYKQEGFFYRSDTNQTLESVKVNLIYVTTQEMENYNKTGLEKVKVYYGVYDGTFEPFKMFLRGWNLASHRDFQEVGNFCEEKWFDKITINPQLLKKNISAIFFTRRFGTRARERQKGGRGEYY